MSERERIERADTLAAPSEGEGGAVSSFDVSRPLLAARYELLGLLGTGGMGAVYRVRDTELGEIVALKMLRPEWGRDASALARFREEVRLARRVTHNNVARTFDIGDHGGERFLTMECVDGGSLAAKLAEGGPIAPPRAVEIATAIAAGLAAAHHAGVVHRDLKPENVLIARDGRVVVTDFGIAHATGASEDAVVGTPAYMAPEQLVPRATVDHRADIYALGAVLYEMLSGERAWKGDDAMVVLAARLRAGSSASSPSLRGIDGGRTPPDLAEVVSRCMARSPDDRFATADDVARALSDAGCGAGSTATEVARSVIPRPTQAGKTVAVLPLSGGPDEDAYIAAGLTDDLIDTLSMTRGLLVRPRGVVARFRGTDRAPSDVGRELGVQAIVEGSVRRLGSEIRASVRVIGVEDGFQLWANRFTAPLADLLVVSDTAARAIADVLTADLELHVRTAVQDPAAIELYLRGKEEYWRTWHKSATGAAALFDRAHALAPDDPKILAAAAMAHARCVFWGDEPREENRRIARELAERAVLVAPDVGDAWAAAASFYLNVGDAPQAARALRQGLQRAPNFASLQDMLGRLLGEVGAVDEAIVRLEIALGLDPTLVAARQELSRLYFMAGDRARADAHLDAIAPGEPSVSRDVARARLRLWGKDPPVPVPEATEPGTYMRIYSEFARSGVLTPDQRAFMRSRVAETAARLRPLFLQRNAEIFAVAGDVDGALESIGDAIAGDLIDLGWMDRCPVLADVRKDARWPALYAVVAERGRSILEALGRT
jgi:serine/threonine-protein kinase